MAQVVLGSYMVRYPLGGMMSWVLQYLVGLQRLGHEVYFVEKSGYPNACYDPTRQLMSDDCSYGTKIVHELLGRFGLGDRWCYVDESKSYFGLPKATIESVFTSADLFIDMGTHGDWLEEAASSGATALVDGEPGFTQMKRHLWAAADKRPPQYDFYFTTGQNIGREGHLVPTAEAWQHVFHPVVVDMFDHQAGDPQAPFTTVMNWQSYEPLEFEGAVYGHKDVEFEKFLLLPELANRPLEVACAGAGAARARLLEAGWRLSNAQEVTLSLTGSWSMCVRRAASSVFARTGSWRPIRVGSATGALCIWRVAAQWSCKTPGFHVTYRAARGSSRWEASRRLPTPSNRSMPTISCTAGRRGEWLATAWMPRRSCAGCSL